MAGLWFNCCETVAMGDRGSRRRGPPASPLALHPPLPGLLLRYPC